MQKLSYNQIHKIEFNATNKLLNYISEEIKDGSSLDDVEFLYPDFDENKNTLAFNIWISIDFVNDKGQTFIERFLKNESHGLTNLEKEILIERNKSHLSLFEIIGTDGEFIEVLDLLGNKSYTIVQPELSSNIKANDIIFGRVGTVVNHLTFIGDVHYLPVSTKFMFLEEVFIDFNYQRLESPMLTMPQYLKKYSLNLYRIYTNCMFEAMELDEDITSTLYDELDEFESYLQVKTTRISLRKHIANLIDFFEYYLADEDLTLYNLDQIDLDEFFQKAIQDGFISSHEDLNSCISTLKTYLEFLSNMNPKYKDIYKKILNISKSRFDLMKQFALVKSPFKIDRRLSNVVSSYLNEDSVSLIMDYDKFILYIIDRPLSLTTKSQHIKRKNLIEINNILELSEYSIKKSPNQKDFPVIDIFFHISIYLGLLSIDDGTLSVSKKGANYLRLRDEEKYTLFFQYIWSNDFITEISEINNKLMIEKFKKDLVNLLSSFTENINYGMGMVLPAFSDKLDYFFEYYSYLEYVGILKCYLYPNYEVKVTPLGKRILNFLKYKDEKKPECSIVSLESFKKSR